MKMVFILGGSLVTIRISCGVDQSQLAEYSRHLSNHVTEAVIQYVCPPRSDRQIVMRRHWAAGLAPTLQTVAEDPHCVSCCIAADLAILTRQLWDAGAIDVVLPPGHEPEHVRRRLIELAESTPTTQTQFVAGDADLAELIGDGTDAMDANLTTVEHDGRWVAYIVTSMLLQADSVLVDCQQPASAWELVHHINPRAALRTQIEQCSGPSPECVGSDWQQAITEYRAPSDSTRYHSSVLRFKQPVARDDLIAAVADVAEIVVRLDGKLYTTEETQPQRLHSSAGLACLDPVALDTVDGGRDSWIVVTTAHPQLPALHQSVHSRLAELAGPDRAN